MKFIQNVFEESNSNSFRVFEFDKCYIITNPKVASRYVELLFKESNGICNSDILISSDYDEKSKTKKYITTKFSYKEKYTDSLVKKHENIFNIKENKKEVILLIREPERKIMSGLSQILFLKILNEDILSGYTKAYSLYKQKPFNYTFNLFKKYESLLSLSLNKSDSFHHDILDLMNKEMEPEEVKYIVDFFEYMFLLTYKDIVRDIHLSPTNQNNFYLYNLITHNNMVDLNKFRIVDIDEFDIYSEELISLGFDVSIASKAVHSNRNVNSLVELFLSSRENEELKLHFTTLMKSERIFYDSLKLKSKTSV